MKRDIRVLLHDIRSVHNVGAIFRTSDAIGVSKIYLGGYSPMPVDRFNNPRADFSKAALGSEKTMAWEGVESPLALISKLKEEGFQVVSVEQDPTSADYKEVRMGERVLVIFGNEVAGVSKGLLEKSDVIAEIPMNGTKESLNISVSAGIVLYRWFD
ncbi:MAG: TrmH family RNA methyltransferase [Candidatus Paceibacterota bacterium]|jgi:tRNA G18 (ribose-2'-O)-methylase SpoU